MLSIEIYIWLTFTALLLIMIFEGLIIWFIKKIFLVPYKMFRKVKEKKSLRDLKKELVKKEEKVVKSKVEEKNELENSDLPSDSAQE